ncbi:hypothetical protein [Rhodovulum strictum]|uniref:Translation initiation factor 3 n=1 Tax=Rhodovulum strictum TaxID=58314 RepID=A0A844BAK2_9RHOB|nr:hypothetical protein [Rhodovulum strictum]MRH22620.1 hypothetical protein [Rhodovulum strictum]
MKKALITIIILAAVGVGGYIWYIGNMAEEAAAPEAAVETVDEAVEDAAEAVEEAVEEATEEAAEAVDEAVEAAEDAAEAVEEAVTTPPADVLSPEGFDADAVIAMIDESSLDVAEKDALKAAVETARNVPDMLGAVLDQVRTALGM